MKFNPISIDTALNKNELINMGLKYGLVYNYDAVILKELKDIDIDKDLLIEARFFNEEQEVHIFKRDDLMAINFREDKSDEDYDSYNEEHILLKDFGKKLFIRNYIEYDRDNQAYIAYTRPYDAIL